MENLTIQEEINEINKLKQKELKKKYKVPVNKKRLEGMTEEEICSFRKELYNYYKEQEYDKEKHLKDEDFMRKVILFGKPIFDKLYKPRIFNKNNIEKTAEEKVGRIYVSNHIDSLDHFSVISAIGKEPLHPLASTTLLNLKRGELYKRVGCIFINLKNIPSMIKALEEGTKLLANGHSILIFPEGTRNMTDNFLLEFMDGASIMAQATGAKIYPIGINDDYKLTNNNLMVRFGKPITVDITDDIKEKTNEIRMSVATQIYENMYEEKSRNNHETYETCKNKQMKKMQKIEKQRSKINVNR